MLLNAAKFQDHGFYRFWVTKRKPTEGGGRGCKITHLTQIERKL